MAKNTSRKLTIQLDYGDTDQLGMERLIFFSDAVFAIAITLLSLEIRLPDGIEAFSNAALLSQLTGIWHKYLAFMISFMVIGTLWIGHHRKFRFIKRYDSPLLMLNLVLLMVIAFIPFPSAVLSSYSNRIATSFYALVMVLASLLGSAIWWYASRHGLVDSPIDIKKHRRLLITPLVTALIFLASIGIAYLDPDISKFIWMLIIPVSIYMNRS